MKLSYMLVVVLIAISTVQFNEAQQQSESIPQGVEALRQSASWKTDLTLDHSTLVFASRLDPGNEGFRRVIAGLSGISVHSYRFPGSWTYDPGALSSVKQEYQTAGWLQLVNNHDKRGGPGATELWIRLQNDAISDVAVLVARSNEVNFLVLSGSISPLDLTHLAGPFGIPKIEGGVLVPNTERRR
jgi:hypothetical protein